MSYVVYMLTCRDQSIYTGITNDLKARVAKHNAGKGARYTRPARRRPASVSAIIRVEDKSTALRIEARIKSLSRPEKITLIAALKELKHGHL